MDTSHKQNNTLPIIIMIALFFMIAFVTGLPSPMGVIVAKQFGASNFESQLGFFANFIAYAFMGIPAGMLLGKIGYKKTAMAAVLVGFLGVGIQYFSGVIGSFGIYLGGAFISGFSMCMLNTVVNPMLNTLGGGGNKGNQLIQIGGVFGSLGATITPMLVGYLMGAEAGRTIEKASPAMFLAMSIFAVSFIILALVKIPEPYLKQENIAIDKTDRRSPLSFRHFTLGAIAIFIYVGIEVGIPSTANLYMTTFTIEEAQTKIANYERQQIDVAYREHLETLDMENRDNSDYQSQVVTKETYQKAQKIASGEMISGLGISAGIAGIVVGLYWLLMLFARFIGAALAGKISSRWMLTSVSMLGGLFILLALFLPEHYTIEITSLVDSKLPVFIPMNVLFIILCGLCTSVMWGNIFNLAVEGLGKYTSAASGIFMVMVCGGGIIPLLQGFIADNGGYLNSYWVIFIGFIYLLFYGMIGYRNMNKTSNIQ